MGNLFSSEDKNAKPKPATETSPTRVRSAAASVGGNRSTATETSPTRVRSAAESVGGNRSTVGPVRLLDQKPQKLTVISRTKDNCVLVAAIDFGTTFTGYAYSFKHKPEEVFTNYWGGANVKTPTIVLLDRNKKFHSFGTEARNHFLILSQQGAEKGWYYFEHFKMRLFLQKGPLDRNIELEDFEGKKMPAMEVFSAAIRYMKDHLIKRVKEKNEDLNITDTFIHWVLTVPAIWSDSSKQFMRVAATQAGIDNDYLSLALEPEVASLFCRQRALSGLQLDTGSSYLVLDLGGGTADIIAHQINDDGSLTELHQATGGDYGGKLVDTSFINILNKIFGADVVKKFKNKHMREYYELRLDFEVKKKNFDGSRQIQMKFPATLTEIAEEELGVSLSDHMNNSPLKGKVEFKQGKIFISINLAKEMFDKAVGKIMDEASELLQKLPNLDYMIMVGGFSESPYLAAIAKQIFANLILMPKEPSSAVLKGAVIYGHHNKAVASRVCKYTYGIARMMRFKKWHKPEYKVTIGGTDYCDNLFNKHIEIGQKVHVDEDPNPQDYYPSVDHLKHAVLEVYASTKPDPKYVTDESCSLVGLVHIELPDYTDDKQWKINVKLIFGGTELLVEAHEVNTNRKIQASVDFLG